ncbi:MAG: ABC transporter ATP-binding protein [Calditrichaeota bacterium]|nr:MAG: ABC transporter ATP-binding protein [Calditrichota bacterium]
MLLETQHISKRYNRKSILKDISFTARPGHAVALTGFNGSGKTTLIKILTHIIRPDEGGVRYHLSGTILRTEEVKQHIGLVGPYLQLYQELTAFENLQFAARLRQVPHAEKRIGELAEEVGLSAHLNKRVHAFSSGMQQRLKYLFAILSKPEFLFIDEPRSNLDSAGVAWVYHLLEKYKQDRVVVFATNDEQDLTYADEVVAVAK